MIIQLTSDQYLDAIPQTEIFSLFGGNAKMVPNKCHVISRKFSAVEWLRYLHCRALSPGSNLGMEFPVYMLVFLSLL